MFFIIVIPYIISTLQAIACIILNKDLVFFSIISEGSPFLVYVGVPG
jgi:hypothetical protein